MTGLFDLKNHLAFYRAYHSNETNVTIHLICIPIILSTAIFIFSKFTIPITLLDDYIPHQFVNLGTLLSTTYGIYYILLDWQVGIPAALFYGGIGLVYNQLYYFHAPSLLSSITKEQLFRFSWITHILAWLAQFYGHAFHEHRAPALLDNLLQAVVLAPFFVAFEVAFWLGFKLDTQKFMEVEAAKQRKLFETKKSS